MSKILGREEFLRVDDRPVEEVEVTGGVVRVRAMDARTWGKVASQLGGMDDVGIRLLMCAACLVDESGERIFDPENLDDIALLAGKNFATSISQISDVAIRLSRATRGDVEQMRENFPETPGEDSLSG
jgi:hypothetical protein